MAERPLSPHLFDGMRLHWKWGPHMAVSILHRISGQGMAFVGLPVLLWWLGALASGPGAYQDFHDAATSPVGYVVLVGISWAFFNHLCSGIRHYVLDIGGMRWYRIQDVKNSASAATASRITLRGTPGA